MPSVDLTALSYFIRIAERGTLSAASIATGQSQSALSKKISALEENLGGRLFVRTGRGLTLTSLGRELFPLAKDLLLRTDQFAAHGKSRSKIPTGEVRIGIISSFHFLATDLYLAAARKFPEISLVVSEGYSFDLRDDLAQGRLDLAVLAAFTANECKGGELVGSCDTYLAGPGDEMKHLPAVVDFAYLESIPLALGTGYTRQYVESIAKRLGLKLAVKIEVDSTRMLVDLVSRAPLYTLLAKHSVASLAESGILGLRPLANPAMRRHIALYDSTSRPHTLAVRVIKGLLLDRLGSLLDKDAASSRRLGGQSD